MPASIIDLAAFRAHRVAVTPSVARCLYEADLAKRPVCLNREASRAAACAEALRLQGMGNREVERDVIRTEALAAAVAFRVTLNATPERRAI